MRRVDVKRLAASYGLKIDEKTWLRQACNGKCYKATSVILLDWKLAWGGDGRWSLASAPHWYTTLGMFGPDGSNLLPPEIVDKQLNPEGCFEVHDYKVVNFVRNGTYNQFSNLKIWKIEELKQFFDDFYEKWAEKRKLHKIDEISSVLDDYTV